MRLLRSTALMLSLGLRDLPSRARVIASVVFANAFLTVILIGTLAIAHGFADVVRDTGRPDVAIILQKGALSESTSVIPVAQRNLIGDLDGIMRGPAGEPIVSFETFTIIDATRLGISKAQNVTLRGVSSNALLVRGGVKLAAGRMPQQGSCELTVGQSIYDLVPGAALGKRLPIANQQCPIVGVIAASGRISDSEIWMDSLTAQQLFRVDGDIQSARVLLDRSDGLERIKAALAADPRLGLDVESEAEYFSKSATSISSLVKGVGIPLAVAIALGALASIVNAMQAVNQARAAELVTLRCIGFRPLEILFGSLGEGIALSLAGAAAGVLISILLFWGRVAALPGADLTGTSFRFELNASEILVAVVWCAVLGLAGSLPAAVSVLRTPLRTAAKALE